MTRQIAEQLIEYSQNELEITEDYSGRGMSFNTTIGVIGSKEDFNLAFSEMIFHKTNNDKQRRLLGEAYMNLNVDTMGVDMIFY